MTIININNIELDFLKKFIKKDFDISKLTGDASTRQYFRIQTRQKSYLLCKDNMLKGSSLSDYPFYIIYNLFKKEQVPVPEIYQTDSQNGLILIEDFGDNLIEQHVKELSVEQVYDLYKNIIDELLKIQSITEQNITPFKLQFDVEKLMFEFNFFIDNYLINYLKLNISQHDLESLKKEFIKICLILDNKKHFVLNHRDFHSRNILLRNDRLAIIDYQDARMGLPVYDIVSLLKDSYYTVPSEIINKLIEYYYINSKNLKINKFSKSEFDYYFDLMAFQRNIKALGSFGYLISVKKNNRYKQSIKPTILYLKDYVERQSDIKVVYNLLKNFGAFN